MISQDKHLETVFPEALLVAFTFRRQRIIRKEIIRAKVAPKRQSGNKLILNGLKKCVRYQVCSYVVEGNIVKEENLTWKFN